VTLLPCPFCGSEAETFEASEDSFSILCTGCGVETPYLPYLTEAIAAWNRRAEQNNTPLALDEIISRCTPKAAELLKNGLLGAVKVCAVEEITPKTNADRIRSMSDEELHKFLLDFEAGDIDYAKTFCALCCKDAALERKSTDCEGCLLWWLKNDATLPQGIDWLKQPAKED